MHGIFRNILRLALAIIPTIAILTACNSDSPSTATYDPVASVAVKSFKLNANANILSNLDSVYFSIDLDRGVIFNADSLPLGTDITRLVPVISYASSVETAEITMTGGKRKEGTVDYKAHPSDTLDFSGNVVLRLTAASGELERSYRIKINVHKSVADSLMWDKVAQASLPSRLGKPRHQKTVAYKEQAISIIEEANGSLTLAKTSDIASSDWQKSTLSLSFAPQIRSLSAGDNALYLLDTDGNLYTSADGNLWQSVGVKWSALLGGYGDSALGIINHNGTLCHDIYPRPAGFPLTKIDDNFPASGMSNMLVFASKWTAKPLAWLIGGSRDGKALSATWAYDGSSWANISNSTPPALEEALILPYFMYRQTSTSWIQTEYSVTLCLGGRLPNGEINRAVWMTYDNGVTWIKAESLMQLPKYIPSLYAADAIIATTPMHGSLNSYWSERPTPRPSDYRISYFIDGSEVDWECPYLYIIGGQTADNTLSDAIWRAVLARLTYMPLF